MVKYFGFYLHHRSYYLWSSVIVLGEKFQVLHALTYLSTDSMKELQSSPGWPISQGLFSRVRSDLMGQIGLDRIGSDWIGSG